MTFYIAQDDQQRGPFGVDELQARGLRPDTLVWREGMPSWERADTVAELRPLFATEAAAQTTSSPPAPVPPPTGPTTLQYDAGPAAYAAAYAGGYATAPSAGLAVASMVLGILAVPLALLAFCLWWASAPLAILSIVLGHAARAQVRHGRAAGAGMALAGLICGYIALAFTVVALLTWASLFLHNA